MLCHEYGWSRHYVLWGLAFGTGLKFVNSIIRRNTGHDQLAENCRDQYLRKLAKIQNSFAKN